MARLELNSVGKAFGAVCCANDLSLIVEPGEIVAVFGPSGSGKTVLLRMIGGMFEPDEGDILVGGRSIVGAPPEQRGIGMAFQNFALFPHMSAQNNIASGLRKKAASDEVAAKVSSISRLLKIEHVLGHMPRELSNGQKQRTALARALIGNPEVLLLDDPLRNVDAKLRYEMRLELPSLLRRSSAAVLYVTQDYREAMAIADRIAVLIEGRLVQVARPEEVYARPAIGRCGAPVRRSQHQSRRGHTARRAGRADRRSGRDTCAPRVPRPAAGRLWRMLAWRSPGRSDGRA